MTWAWKHAVLPNVESALLYSSSEKLKKANTMLGLIRRSFTYLAADIVMPLYKSFVRHHLENCATVWSCNLKMSQVTAIEKVQMRATEMIEGLKHLEYSERLQRLKLPTLVYRRARGRMIEVWRHFHSHDPAVASDMFEMAKSQRVPYQIRRGRVSYAKRSIQANSFYCFAPLAWNMLAGHVRNAEMMDIVSKRSLTKPG